MEISAEQLKKLNDGEYTVYDIRSETDRAYGFIPGSVHTTADELENNPPADQGQKNNNLLRAWSFQHRHCGQAVQAGLRSVQPRGRLSRVDAL